MIRSLPKTLIAIRLATLVACSTVHLTGAGAALAAEACDSPVLTLDETADLLRVPETDVQRLAEQREMPGRKIGEAWRFNGA